MLNCSASGNPEPTYKWVPILSNGPMTVDGPVLTINERMAGIRNTWRCQAINNAQIIESIEIDVDFDISEYCFKVCIGERIFLAELLTTKQGRLLKDALHL
eukprot:GHVO01036265.1.p1 GENE.GHVO01036265.1~~GHVO01036265.1.p1  ORF type:complete len:101 (-),score=4.77 GHVO01036265.1:127-429(-)